MIDRPPACAVVASYVSTATPGDSAVEVAVGVVLAVAAGFVTTVATVALVYMVFPRRPPNWRAVLRGATIAASGVSLLSAAYVMYLRYGANFERRYASDALAAVVLFGLWLFTLNAALLIGYRAARRRDPGRD